MLDNAGRRIQTSYPDGYTVYYNYDILGELTNTYDNAGESLTNWFDNQGLLYAALDAAGTNLFYRFDDEDRLTNSWDANAVGVAMTYDNLGRLLTRTYPDGGTDYFGYSPAGLIAYTNQIGYVTLYTYDQARRKIGETNANAEVTSYSYNAAGDLLTLTDPKSHTTTWDYDPYGRVTNKLDQTSTEILRYAYDPDNRLTNRWSAAKGNTGYAYDPVGNLTNIAYPSSGTVKFAYDALNRLTNMVDSVGTTHYAYDAAGQLVSTSGPFGSDALTNTYSNRKRVALSLQGVSLLGETFAGWTNGFGWDLAGRLTNVTSPAGAFAYTYAALSSSYSGRLVQELGLPGGAAITNFYDPVARLLGTVLNNSGGSTLDFAYYGYNAANQRTACTNASSGVGTHLLYTYDPIGQLTEAYDLLHDSEALYVYDAAGNLTTNYPLGAGKPWTYDVDARNEVTNANQLGPMTYDANGNLTSRTNWDLSYEYDDENRLSAVQLYYMDTNSLPQGWRTVFEYDGLGRLRWRLEYVPQTGFRPVHPLDSGSWSFDHGVEYIYDGWRVIQERAENNTPVVAYTRGLDLSGSFQGAGGIGGLLARSITVPSNWFSHAYYHADGNGNITCLIDTNQSVVASYRYDPFGNTISQSGSLADANTYRFSSKEIHVNSGMYYYGYRFYDPSLQRWPNRDPLGEDGGLNLYAYCLNSPLNFYDADGLLGTPAENLALILAIGPEEAAEILGISVEAAKAIALAGATIGSKCDTKAWHHESPNPDKTKKRGDHKNRPDGKRDRDPQPKPPEKPPQPPPTPPYDGPPKDGGPPRPRPGR